MWYLLFLEQHQSFRLVCIPRTLGAQGRKINMFDPSLHSLPIYKPLSHNKRQEKSTGNVVAQWEDPEFDPLY